MYKITLNDNNYGAFISGVTSFFVDDIESFELKWLNNPKVSKQTKENYLKSKKGILISDYYVTTKDTNIFQRDPNAKVLKSYSFRFEEKEFEVHNFYEYKTVLYCKKAEVKYRKIRFDDNYYLIGCYRLEGVCRFDEFTNDWKECYNWGNQILNIKHQSDLLKNNHVYGSKEIYNNDIVETICWVTVACSKKENDLPNESDLISKEILDNLLIDIVGEGG